MKIEDVVIIGAGPAGIATAIQLRRYNIDFVLLEYREIGGLLRNANLIENYPGFPHGIRGLDLVELFKRQLKNAGVNVSFERAWGLEYRDELFFIKTDQRVITSHIVVCATGTKPKEIPNLDIPDAAKERVFYEIYPIMETKNKSIAILGAGDAAFDYALSLSQTNKVTILNRNDRVKCIPTLKAKCMRSKNVSYLPKVSVKRIDHPSDKLLLTCSEDGYQIWADYVIVAIGREPHLDFLDSELRKKLDILANEDRFWMVGDVKNGIYRQTAICVGDGIKAAMEIYRRRKMVAL